MRERWNAQAAGINAGGVPILTSGLKFNPISVSNQDAQIVEQMKLTDRTVAAVMGVPAILLGISDSATQKSAEARHVGMAGQRARLAHQSHRGGV